MCASANTKPSSNSPRTGYDTYLKNVQIAHLLPQRQQAYQEILAAKLEQAQQPYKSRNKPTSKQKQPSTRKNW